MSKKAEWIKISTGIFDEDDRIKRIEKRTDRDSIMIIWFKLNVQAGRCNAGGTLQFTDVIPLDIESLADLFNRSEEEVKTAIDLFMSWGMMEQDEDGFYYLLNWEEDQNEEALSKIRENGNNRVKRFREKRREERQAAKAEGNKAPTPPKTPAPPKETVEKVLPPYDEIIDYYNQAMGKKRSVTDALKKAIDGLYKSKRTMEDIKLVIDKKIADWKGTEREKYIDPSTLFRKDNFDKYLNEPWPKGKRGKPKNENTKNNGGNSGNWAFVE